jgi:hypothetical protein
MVNTCKVLSRISDNGTFMENFSYFIPELTEFHNNLIKLNVQKIIIS